MCSWRIGIAVRARALCLSEFKQTFIPKFSNDNDIIHKLYTECYWVDALMYAALDRKYANRLNPFRKVGAFRSFNALNSIPTEIKQSINGWVWVCDITERKYECSNVSNIHMKPVKGYLSSKFKCYNKLFFGEY